MNRYALHLGDCLETLRTLPDNSVDSIVTDPPYGLSKEPDMAEVLRHWLAGDDYQHKGGGFMGKTWDSFVPGPAIWKECLRVLKPGGHLLAFFGSRTQDIGTLAIRLAGFEIRDSIAWVYGSGFPKSLDVSKAIDKAAGAERKVIGSKAGQPGYSLKENDTDQHNRGAYGKFTDAEKECAITEPATDEAAQWQGWGTALKPALDPITVARKPLVGTVAANVLAHGTGALNIDGCRIDAAGDDTARVTNGAICGGNFGAGGTASGPIGGGHPAGRWPANLIHDGSDGPVELLGDAARFFYCAKASRKDRNEGLDSSDAPAVTTKATMREREDADWPERNGNHHPTVKPTDLMAYLCRLVTPAGGTVLDPFMGSGSTGKAAIREGFGFIGCELSPEYLAIAEARIAHEISHNEKQQDLFDLPTGVPA